MTLEQRAPDVGQFFNNGEVEFLLDRHYGFLVGQSAQSEQVRTADYLDRLLAEQLSPLADMLIASDHTLVNEFSDATLRDLRHQTGESWRQPLPIRYATALAHWSAQTSDNVITSFYSDPTDNLSTYWSLLSSPHAQGEPEHVNQITPEQVRAWIAANPWTVSDIIDQASHSDELELRRAAAMNSSCPTVTLTRLAADHDPIVRRHVWTNRSSSDELRATALLLGIGT
jgi:hypothetical protein